MIVVDTNMIGYLFLSGERSSQAEQVLAKDIHWTAPLLWRSELRNVLATYLNQKLIELEDAFQIMAAAEQLMTDSEYADCIKPGAKIIGRERMFGIRL